MTIVVTEELRLAIREFKEKINALNFVINYQEPPYPIGSIENLKAQLNLANEYLEKHPQFHDEEFNTIGHPLFVKDSMESRIKQKELLADRESTKSIISTPTIKNMKEFVLSLSDEQRLSLIQEMIHSDLIDINIEEFTPKLTQASEAYLQSAGGSRQQVIIKATEL